jgi:acyl carrier protein
LGQIEEKIKGILAVNLENKITAKQINRNDELKDFGINSISFIKIIVGIETEFGIEFADEDLDTDRFQTVQSLVDYVKKKELSPFSLPAR